MFPAEAALGTPNDNLAVTSDDTWARWNYTLSINADTDGNGGTLGDYEYRFTFKNTLTNTTLDSVTLEQALATAGLTPAQIAGFNSQNLFQDSITSNRPSDRCLTQRSPVPTRSK